MDLSPWLAEFDRIREEVNHDLDVSFLVSVECGKVLQQLHRDIWVLKIDLLFQGQVIDLVECFVHGFEEVENLLV